MNRFRLTFPLVFVLLTLVCAGARAAEPIVTSDLLRLRHVGSIDVAPDGSRAVFAVQSIGRAASDGDDVVYTNQSHLYLLDLTGSDVEPRRLTWGDREDHSPVFSPDGRSIAFVRKVDDRPQIWLMPTSGGEARSITNIEYGAGAPVWSPDGRRLMFAVNLPLDELSGTPPFSQERPQRTWHDIGDVTPRPDGTRAEIRAWLARNADADNPNVINRLEFVGDRTIRKRMGVRHLFIIEPGDSDAEPRRITSGFRDHTDAVFDHDGRSVLCARKPQPEVHPDRVQETEICRIALDGSTDETLINLDGWMLKHPRPSRDGSVLAFLAQQTDEPMFRQWRLGISSIEEDGASEPVWLTDEETFDYPVLSFEWMPTRSAIVFNSAREGAVALMTMGLGLLEPATLVDQHNGSPIGVWRFGVGGGAIVYSATTNAQPCVLRVRDASGDRVVWDLNEWVRNKRLSTPEAGWITRPDGTSVQYWLMPPTDLDPRNTYPLVLEIHGGPNWMWGPGSMSMWHEFQLLCSWGYAVVYANPRGSGGYGYAFQKANQKDWGAGPAGDVLAVVDQAILREWIDRERLVVTGGSYGGYLTAWIIANDNRFKAAVAQRGVYEFDTFFGEGSAWRLIEQCFGGWPWQPAMFTLLRRESPFYSVQRIRTPLLIIHADDDRRTGFVQSEMLYRALKVLGRSVEYVRYPDADHNLSRTGDPAQRMDRLNRMIEFFERFIENDRPAPQSSSDGG